MNDLIVSRNVKGRCILAGKSFSIGETIEMAPMLKFKNNDVDHWEDDEYSFIVDDEHWGLGLGYVSLYNHSYDPNAKYDIDTEEDVISVIAVKDIKVGEEITFNYNGEGSTEPVWFDVIEEKPKRTHKVISEGGEIELVGTQEECSMFVDRHKEKGYDFIPLSKEELKSYNKI